MEDQWKIAKHDPQWKQEFVDLASKLRDSMGDQAIRIDHVGSTSVLGLDAKPIIDIKLSVRDIEDILSYRGKIEKVGFILREDNPDQTKRYFREVPGNRRVHLHVRQAGSFSEQLNLLFRDYLRDHPADCLRYAEEKHRLFELFKNDRSSYVDGKAPIVWDIIHKAHLWSQEIGWKPGLSDM
ncbi:hypothetical protein A8709_16775 [Paenibacillus pectinilyticus]|uniref:GrpB family protein n=1 Tax=Paenibacillus pectinilyticus TaxID=512399 RepID=A0A1C1A8I4_9BACL|nr:GrpB family protein [Paenibacillus pectinilyticus]OCT16927.1 hypothetical protein A8709_16775 [Paenibacillus pectinilyticus]